MQNLAPITEYFHAERAESLLFIAVGVLANAMAMWGWRRGPLWRGAAVPLVAVALIQLTVGGTVWLRSPQDVQRVQQIVATDKARVGREEVPRMQAVMKNFVIYRWVEIALLAAGLVLLLAGRRGSAWQGVGVGLAVQSGLMLLLDFFAERRGQVYLDWLQTLG